MAERHMAIVKHYERCLALHGDTHRGVDWPNAKDARTRYQVMLEVMRDEKKPIRLLDFGCGASHLYEYIQAKGLRHIHYSGLDLSEKFIALSRKKFPKNTYYCQDILRKNNLPMFDYVVMNGVFTEKRELPFKTMRTYFQKTIQNVFRIARMGIAFNVMSQHVDWKRKDLFHVPYDDLAAFLKRNVSRHFVFRSDYGLYEYTTYVYRQGRA